MKTLITSVLFLMSFNLFAARVTVDTTWCGEMDPFVVGDTCILFATTTANSKVAVVLDFDEFQEKYADGGQRLVGKKISLEFARLTKITERDVISVLKDYDRAYHYMYGSVDAIKAN